MTLILRRNDFSSLTRDDFTVVERDEEGHERYVGRIYSRAGAKADRWLWAMEGFGSALADTREEAMAALKAQWGKRKP